MTSILSLPVVSVVSKSQRRWWSTQSVFQTCSRCDYHIYHHHRRHLEAGPRPLSRYAIHLPIAVAIGRRAGPMQRSLPQRFVTSLVLTSAPWMAVDMSWWYDDIDRCSTITIIIYPLFFKGQRTPLLINQPMVEGHLCICVVGSLPGLGKLFCLSLRLLCLGSSGSSGWYLP